MGKNRVADDEMIAEINRLYKSEGKSGQAIAGILYISIATVYRYLDSPKKVGRRNVLTLEQIEEINKLYGENYTYKELAIKYGVSLTTIKRRIREQLKKYNKIKSTEQLQEINKLYDDYVPVKDIAEMFDLSDSTVRRYLWNPRQRQNQWSGII